MKRRIICLISIALALLLLSSCGVPDSWQTVELEGVGNFRAPETWKISIIDGFMFISSEESGESKNVLVQYTYSEWEHGKGFTKFDTNKYFDDIEVREFISGTAFSNETLVDRYRFQYKDGSTAEMFLMCFSNFHKSGVVKEAEFLCLDDSISESILEKIANSFDPDIDYGLI